MSDLLRRSLFVGSSLRRAVWFGPLLFITAGMPARADPIQWTLGSLMPTCSQIAGLTVCAPTGEFLPYIPFGNSLEVGSGSAAGSFVYDADTNTFSSVDITVTVPVATLANNQAPQCSVEPQLCATFHLTQLGPPGFGEEDDIFQAYLPEPTAIPPLLTGDIFLSVETVYRVDTSGLSAIMTDSGGTLAANVLAGVCSADCINGDIDGGLFVDSFPDAPLPVITTTPASSVPEPGTVLLLGTGALGLFGPIRRKLLPHRK